MNNYLFAFPFFRVTFGMIFFKRKREKRKQILKPGSGQKETE
jgi:hypothetical protein